MTRLRRGDRVCYVEVRLAVQATGERWGRRRVAAALELALDEEVVP